jgi:hypothetical protein
MVQPVFDMVYVALAERLGTEFYTADDFRSRLAHLPLGARHRRERRLARQGAPPPGTGAWRDAGPHHSGPVWPGGTDRTRWRRSTGQCRGACSEDRDHGGQFGFGRLAAHDIQDGTSVRAGRAAPVANTGLSAGSRVRDFVLHRQ